MTVETRPIPSTGEALPVIGVGTYNTFDTGNVMTAREPLRQVLRDLFAAGGSMIDSSPMYGTAESVTGDVLADIGMRDKAFVATKVWIEGRDRGISQMRDSMKKLRVDVMDLMQVHNLVDWRTQLATVRAWKAEGLIRYDGITHYTPRAFRECERVIVAEKPQFVQIPYSIAVRDAEDRILDVCADSGAAVIVNRPVDGGNLFRAVRGKPLPDWAAEFDCTSWGQFFLKYLLGHPAVTVLIPGTADPAHMRDNIAAGGGRMPDAKARARMAALVDGL